MKRSGETRVVVKRNHGKGGTCYLSGLSPQDLSEIPEYRLDLPFMYQMDPTGIRSCSGGLLSMADSSGRIYLCNPTTKQFQILEPKETPYGYGFPSLSVTAIIGSCVGYDSKSDDYRILRVCERRHTLGLGNPREKHRTYDLYSLRDDSWKPIEPPKFHCRLSGTDHTIIYARDKFYWSTLDFQVMCYDCSEERFYLLPSPPNTRGLHLLPVKFYEEDSLGVVLCRPRKTNRETSETIKPDFYIELWIWRDGWDRVFYVSLGGWIHGTDITIYGEFVFVHGSAGPVKDCKRRLVAYDWGKKECKELGIHNYFMGIYVFCYVESTVALPHGKPISIYGSHIIDYGNYFNKYESDDDSYDDDEDGLKAADLKDLEDNGFRIISEMELEEEEEEVGRITNGSMPSVYRFQDGVLPTIILPLNPLTLEMFQTRFAADKVVTITNGSMPSVYHNPNFGYGQSPFNPYNPYIGADGSIIAPQHDLYENPVTWASHPPLIFPTAHNVGLNTPTSSLGEGRVNTVTSGSNSITTQAAPIPQIRGPQGMQNNTPVTNSIDLQETSFNKGSIFKGHKSKTSPLENRQHNLQGEREAQASLGGCLIELISSLKHLIKLFRSS